MRKTLCALAGLACFGTLYTQDARADGNYTCLIIGGNHGYPLSIFGLGATLTVDGVDFDGSGTFDNDTSSGVFDFKKTITIGMYSLPKPILTFTPNINGDGTLHGNISGSDQPPTVLQLGCTSDGS
jgi:hypothetical protein